MASYTLVQRVAFFVIFCIGTRLLITYFAKHANKVQLKYMGLLGVAVSIGFGYIYATGVSRITSYNVCYTKLLRFWR